MPTPPERAIPYGPYGYTNIQRHNATINQPTDPRLATVRNIADLFVEPELERPEPELEPLPESGSEMMPSMPSSRSRCTA